MVYVYGNLCLRVYSTPCPAGFAGAMRTSDQGEAAFALND
jgi:hypothetical protein